jgi:hypothetical protein
MYCHETFSELPLWFGKEHEVRTSHWSMAVTTTRDNNVQTYFMKRMHLACLCDEQTTFQTITKYPYFAISNFQKNILYYIYVCI